AQKVYICEVDDNLVGSLHKRVEFGFDVPRTLDIKASGQDYLRNSILNIYDIHFHFGLRKSNLSRPIAQQTGNPEPRATARGIKFGPLWRCLQYRMNLCAALDILAPRASLGLARYACGCTGLLIHSPAWRDGRGRDEDCSSPPAQIPASAANAPG